MIYKFKQLQQLIVASIHEKWKRENRQNGNQEKSKKGPQFLVGMFPSHIEAEAGLSRSGFTTKGTKVHQGNPIT